jgi:hypothetical protein
MKTNRYRYNQRILFLIIIAILICSFTGCSEYITFSNKNFDFIFEYPRGWNVVSNEQSSELIYAILLGPDTSKNESKAKAFLRIYLGKGEKADQEAQTLISNHIDQYHKARNFNLIKQDTINLDGASGYQINYTYDYDQTYMLPLQENLYLPTETIDTVIPRNGRVYEIWISASQNEWNAREKDIQHILSTFKWK